MRIGIDIDRTITTPFYWLDFYNHHLRKELKPKEIKTYDHHIAFDMTLEAFEQFRSENIQEIHNLALPRNEAIHYVNQLFFKYQETHIITAREEMLSELTQQWLNRHNMNYKALYHLGSTNKYQLALDLSLDVFIEDRLETAKDMIKRQIPTILFNTPYNQGFHHPNLYRVNTWREAYDIICILDKIKSQKQLRLLT